MCVAVFSVIFEANLKYFDDFIISLNSQKYKSFELFLINDGLSQNLLSTKLKQANFPVIVYNLNAKLTPVKIRELGFRELSKKDYKKIIFADTDDMMSSNRIGRSVEMLDKYPIVFTDITLVDQNANIIKSAIWKDRLNDIKVDRIFLYDKNVIGLGNSAIRGAYLQNIEFPESIIAVDWYFFSIILSKQQAGFISDAFTFYRQHVENTIGLKSLSNSRVEFILDVKERHYTEMAIISPEYLEYLDEIKYKMNLLSKGYKAVDEINKNNINFFWWEETNYIKYERNTIDKV